MATEKSMPMMAEERRGKRRKTHPKERRRREEDAMDLMSWKISNKAMWDS